MFKLFFVIVFLFAPTLFSQNLPNNIQDTKQNFSSSPINDSLVVGEFTVRTLDAVSTRQNITNSCNCFREGSSFFGVNLQPVANKTWSQYSYSLGIATIYTAGSIYLWHRSNQSFTKHKSLYRGLSRLLLVSDISYDIKDLIHNWKISK